MPRFIHAQAPNKQHQVARWHITAYNLSLYSHYITAAYPQETSVLNPDLIQPTNLRDHLMKYWPAGVLVCFNLNVAMDNETVALESI